MILSKLSSVYSHPTASPQAAYLKVPATSEQNTRRRNTQTWTRGSQALWPWEASVAALWPRTVIQHSGDRAAFEKVTSSSHVEGSPWVTLGEITVEHLPRTAPGIPDNSPVSVRSASKRGCPRTPSPHSQVPMLPRPWTFLVECSSLQGNAAERAWVNLISWLSHAPPENLLPRWELLNPEAPQSEGKDSSNSPEGSLGTQRLLIPSSETDSTLLGGRKACWAEA